MDVGEGCISDAVHWVRATPVRTTALKTIVVEALTEALTHSQVEYLLGQVDRLSKMYFAQQLL